jgi:protein-tyrosine phosphatase
LSVAQDRVIAVPGTSNFRDFGCCLTGTGAMVSGRLYRSAHLGNVGAPGAERLAELGVATIIDLRGVGERATALPAFAAERNMHVVSTPIEPASTPRIRALLAAGRGSGAEIREIMIATYRRFVEEEALQFGRALAALGDASAAPLVIHCTAGKDRTGFLVAVIQALLGVPRETIFAGYEATNHAWDRPPSAAIPLPIEADAREALLAADPAYLEASFAAISGRDGSVAGFVLRALGSDARAVDELAERLLEARIAAATTS